MPGPSSSERGISNRAIESKLGADLVEDIETFVPWADADDIASALADGLVSEQRFEQAMLTGDGLLAHAISTRLLLDFHFLCDQAAQSGRDPKDGALLLTGTTEALFAAAFPSTSGTASGGASSTQPWAPDHFPAGTRTGYPARPKHVSEIPPFTPANVRRWSISKRARVVHVDHLQAPEPHVVPKTPAAKAAYGRASETIDQGLADMNAGVFHAGPAPTLRGALESLRHFKITDISKQTHVAIPDPGQFTLLQRTAFIVFHGAAYSFILKPNGEPFAHGAGTQYGLVVPEPGTVMLRTIPPPGLYVSVRRAGFSTFEIEGRKIRTVLSGGIGAFADNLGGGVVQPDEVTKSLQGQIGSQEIAAEIVLPSANDPRKITASRIADELPALALSAVPYAMREMIRKAREKGYAKTIEQMGNEVLHGVVIDIIREQIVHFIEKKIGEEIVPVVNVAFAINDMIRGEEKRMRIRTAIACVIVALSGRSPDEYTLATKVLGLVMADEFEEQLIKLLQKGFKRASGLEPSKAEKKRREEEKQKQESQPKEGAPKEPDIQWDQSDLNSKIVPPRPDSTNTGHIAGVGMGERINAHQRDATPAESRASDDGHIMVPGERINDHNRDATPRQSTDDGTIASIDTGERVAVFNRDPTATDDRGTGHRGTDETGAEPPPMPATRTQRAADWLDRHTEHWIAHHRSEAPTGSFFEARVGVVAPVVPARIGTRGHEVRVSSRLHDVLVGGDLATFRRDALRIILADPAHPLRVLVDPRTHGFYEAPAGASVAHLRDHPAEVDAGAVMSGDSGRRDLVILQTRYRILHHSADAKREEDVVIHGRAVDIGGIAVGLASAVDLVTMGVLDLTVSDLGALQKIDL